MSLTAHQGDVVAIIGGSGSGQSTFLRCINFLETPSSGEIIINGESGLAGVSFGNSLIKQVASDLAMGFPNLNTFVTLSPIPKLASWAQDSGYAPTDLIRASELAATYLLDAKTRAGVPLDPVARFHLGNGATIHAVHDTADISPKGISQSFGTMVNYLYDFESVEQHHENYTTNKTVAASAEVMTKAATAVKLLQNERR